MRRLAVAVTAGTVVAAALPAAADAHGLVQRANLPIPEWLFGGAAAIVLVVSFVALSVLWSRPRIDGADAWQPLPVGGRALGSRALEEICQAVGGLLLVVVIV